MAYYNNGFPVNYPYYQQQSQMQPQMQPQMQMQPSAQQIQSGGIIPVRSEMEARNYPVALGNSITFKDETSPYIYTKTMGFSQLDIPKFDKYKLVKEEVSEAPAEPIGMPYDDSELLKMIDGLQNDVADLWHEIVEIKTKKGPVKKKEVIDNDAQ